MAEQNMEWGMRRGLAQVLPSQQDQMYQVAMLKQRAKDGAAAKAKMFADDFEYNNAMNGHDNPLVKDYATKSIKEIGGFIRQNPDWETNPMARAQYKIMIHNLKDNPDLNRGLKSDESYNAWQKYIKDPKNTDMRDDPEIAKINSQWDNYIKFGNQFGEEEAKKNGKKEFTFVAPEDLVDTTAKLVELAQKTERDERSSFGYGGFRQSVSNHRKDGAVGMAVNSTWGKYLKKDYDKYLKTLQDPSKAESLNQFVRRRMNPYFKEETIDKGFAPPVMRSGGGGGDGSEMTPSIWREQHVKAANTPGQKIEFGSAAIDATFSNKLGEHNLVGVKDPFGNMQDLGLRKASATGLVEPKKTSNGQIYSEYEALVRLPVQEFQKLGPEYNKIIDEGGMGQFTPGPSGSTNWDIREEGQNLGFKQYTDEKGNKFVEYLVRQKYDPLNVHLSDNYANAHNVSPRKEDPYQDIANNYGSTPPNAVYQGNDGYYYDANKKRIQ